MRLRWGRCSTSPGVFVFGSNDYFSPTLRNPLRYLLPDDGKRNTAHAPAAVAGPRPGLHRRRLGRPHQPPRHRWRWRDCGSPSPAWTTRTWATTGSTRSPARRTPTPTCGWRWPTRRTCGCWTSSPPTGTTRSSPATRTAARSACPGGGALTTNCDLEPARAKGLHRHPADSAPGDPGSSWLHVSAGLGTSPYARIRVACRPEATLLTLRAAAADRAPGAHRARGADYDGRPGARVCSPCSRAGRLVGPAIGLWRSLVARLVRDEEAAGSNPVSPTSGTQEPRPPGDRGPASVATSMSAARPSPVPDGHPPGLATSPGDGPRSGTLPAWPMRTGTEGPSLELPTRSGEGAAREQPPEAQSAGPGPAGPGSAAEARRHSRTAGRAAARGPAPAPAEPRPRRASPSRSSVPCSPTRRPRAPDATARGRTDRRRRPGPCGRPSRRRPTRCRRRRGAGSADASRSNPPPKACPRSQRWPPPEGPAPARRQPAAVLTGVVVGLATVGLTWASQRGCEAVRGTSPAAAARASCCCSRSLVAMVLPRCRAAPAPRSPDPGEHQLPGRRAAGGGRAAVPRRRAASAGGWSIVIPLCAAVTYALSHWVASLHRRVSRDAARRLHRRRRRQRAASSSAICTVLSAAPLRRLSFEMNSARPRSSVDARVLPDPADVRRVPAGRLQRRRDVGELDARGAGQQLAGPLGGHRPLELGVDRQRVAGEDRHPHADARRPAGRGGRGSCATRCGASAPRRSRPSPSSTIEPASGSTL